MDADFDQRRASCWPMVSRRGVDGIVDDRLGRRIQRGFGAAIQRRWNLRPGLRHMDAHGQLPCSASSLGSHCCLDGEFYADLWRPFPFGHREQPLQLHSADYSISLPETVTMDRHPTVPIKESRLNKL